MTSELRARLEAAAEAQMAQSPFPPGPAHDILHVRRVARSAQTIAEAEDANARVATAAALLHELFNYPKDHPESAQSGAVCADHAEALLRSQFAADFTADEITAIADCIRAHGWTANVAAPTLEAQIVQDADRLDAIGAIGVARCFSTGATMNRPFYADEDPFCTTRAPDDKSYTLDHFYRKLLRLPATLHTATAREMGEKRAAFLQTFLEALQKDL